MRGMLHTVDADIASRFPDRLARMMVVAVALYREFELTISENKTHATSLWSVPR